MCEIIYERPHRSRRQMVERMGRTPSRRRERLVSPPRGRARTDASRPRPARPLALLFSDYIVDIVDIVDSACEMRNAHLRAYVLVVTYYEHAIKECLE